MEERSDEQPLEKKSNNNSSIIDYEIKKHFSAMLGVISRNIKIKFSERNGCDLYTLRPSSDDINAILKLHLWMCTRNKIKALIMLSDSFKTSKINLNQHEQYNRNMVRFESEEELSEVLTHQTLLLSSIIIGNACRKKLDMQELPI
jgi:hypothetical protein